MLISVIIPVYNVEDTLARAVNSVIEQTEKNLEIILVDDGSTDSSGFICDELAMIDNRIKVIHKENGGLSSARNAGIEVAKGDFLSFLDSDDYLSKDIYESFVEAYIKNNDLDIYQFNVVRLEKGNSKTLNSVKTVSTDTSKNIANLFDYSGIDFYAWNKIYAKKLFTKIRYPLGKLYEDISTTYATTKLASKVVTTDKIGIYYIANSASIVASDFNPKQYDNVTERILLLDKIKQDSPKNYSRALEKVIDGFLSTGYKIAISKESSVTKEYYDILKKEINTYLKIVTKDDNINKLKLVALKILLFNKLVYKKLYKLYLGK